MATPVLLASLMLAPAAPGVNLPLVFQESHCERLDAGTIELLLKASELPETGFLDHQMRIREYNYRLIKFQRLHTLRQCLGRDMVEETALAALKARRQVDDHR